MLRECLDPHIDHSESSSGEYLTFNRGGIGKRTMRKLARGSFSIQDELDLHGMTVEQASEALTEFLSESTRRGYCCVRVVHGKGLGSGNRGPVLKRKVSFWLRRWSQTLAYVSARQVDGGTGALYVLLRRE